MRTAILNAAALLAAGAAHAQQPAQPAATVAMQHGMAESDAPMKSAPHARLIDARGQQVGTVVAQDTPNGLLLSVAAQGLPPGEHAVHVHETGRCDAAQGFKTAGDHFAPQNNPHGFETADGPHGGDLPNQWVASDGTMCTHVFAANLRLKDGPGAVTDADGSAFIIHAGADDYRSQPSGNAGDRIACVVIARPR